MMNIIVNTPGDTDKKQVFTIFQNVLEKAFGKRVTDVDLVY